MNYPTYVVLLFLLKFASSESETKFGEYVVFLESAKSCEFENKESETIAESNVTVTFDKSRLGLLQSNLTVFKEDGPVMYKSRVWQWTGKKYIIKLSMPPKNACIISFMRTTFKMFIDFSTIDATCIVKKGTMLTVDADIDKLARLRTGKSFFFGKYKVKAMFYTANSNIICVEVVIHFKQK